MPTIAQALTWTYLDPLEEEALMGWFRRSNKAAVIAASVWAAACGPEAATPALEDQESEFESDIATLLDLEFDGELVTRWASAYSPVIRSQMYYTVGAFNEHQGVARLNRLKLSNIRARWIGSGLYRVTYHAKLPVAWPEKEDLPTELTFTLPRRADTTGQSAFVAEYAAACSDGEGDSATLANYWYHYRPGAAGCVLDPADVVEVRASASVSAENTPAQYPELHRVWEDGVLRVVAIFGKYEKGATSPYDAGIRAYAEFVGALDRELEGAMTTPAELPAEIGVLTPDITFETSYADGRAISINAILVDELKTEGAAFDKRFNALSTAADAILYNGHAGLGSNIAALTRKGQFHPDHYQVFFMNGCDTFAYADDTLPKARSSLNPGVDPNGTKYLDIAYNAMPAYFHAMTEASMAFLRTLKDPSQPRTFTAAFREVDPIQVIVGIGTEDNAFQPRAPFAPVLGRTVLTETGAVGYAERDTFTRDLDAGTYRIALQHAPAAQAGDADLRIQIDGGSVRRCTSRFKNTNEYCDLTLTRRSQVTVSVTGDYRTGESPYELRAFRKF